ncbi:MAG TPA: hypothetical protein VK666_03570, partial [Chryseolinea sp.]|nr:hypothetical protein [Chryseolinea sp.]
MLKTLILGSLLAGCCVHASAQDSSGTEKVSGKYLEAVSAKSQQLQDKLDKKTNKLLSGFEKQEARLLKKWPAHDSVQLKAAIENKESAYRQLKEKMTAKAGGIKKYIPSLDTLGTSLSFLKQNPSFLPSNGQAVQKVDDALAKVKGLETKFQQAAQVKEFLKQRQQYLKDQLAGLGFAKQLKQLNKKAYYYNEQVNEYKSLLKDHKKAERKAVNLLSKTKLFKDFMKKNSQLASLFRLPGDPNEPGAQASLAGLQTRVQVNNLIQQQMGISGQGGMAQVQQNIQQAQGQLSQLKNKLTQYGQSSSEDIMPEGFKPNGQKTRRFLQRLEFGTNIQSQRANGFFPTTSDIGLSMGYKLNDKSVIGIGGSYKVGWGRSMQHVSISHQGIGLRSFIDY